MTKIDFFSNAPNRLDYVIRLLKKVQGAKQTAVVYGEESTLNALSDALWQQDGFCAHDVYHEQNPTTLVADIVLVSSIPNQFPHHSNLINLTDSLPNFFAAFTRLIEVVPADEAPRQAARERWLHYKSRGYVMSHHDIAAKNA